MDSRQQTTHDALYQLDPELAGLFARGCELVDRVEEPGVPYLIGHIGREVGKSVLELIARELPPVSEPPKAAASGLDEDRLRVEMARLLRLEPEDTLLDAILDLLGDAQRDTISRALSLDRDHPLVGSWLRVQKDLVAATHYRKGGRPPSPERAREAFHKLSGLLFNRVGPYFQAQGELDALLAIPEPEAEHVARLGELLVRPQLRFRFFRMLQNPRWLVPLREAGAFDGPPEWVRTPDGGWRLMPWPEGECLVRFAAAEPQLVVDALLRVPPDLQNPAVWQIVARAALSLPPSTARRLVPGIGGALRKSLVRFFSDTAAEVATRLAEAQEVSAFDLAAAVLWLKAPPKDQGPEETRFFRQRSQSLLVVLEDSHEVHEFLGKTIPALARFDGMATWTLLVERLRRAQRLLVAAGFKDENLSHHWCESLDSADADDDVRAQLAVAAMSVARRLLAEDSGRLGSLLESLRDDGSGLFARMRLGILAAAGQSAQAQIDDAIADPVMLDPAFGARETASILRAHFESASSEARGAFVRALEDGPGDNEVRSMVEWHGQDPEDPAARGEALQDWQRRRLRWFHDRIPLELATLAQRLGVAPEKPSLEQQALDEVGFWSSGVYSRGETSPKSVEELRALTSGDLLTFLETWQPSGRSHEAPSRSGLADVLAALLTDDPTTHAALIGSIAVHEGLHPAYRRAVLGALRKAADAGRQTPWAESMELVKGTLELAERATAGQGRNEWSWARREAADFLQECCTGDRLPIEYRDRAFTLAELLVRTSPAWYDQPSTAIRQFGDIVHATLNSDAGKSTYVAIAVALWAYRASGATSTSALVQRVRPILEFVRTRQDPGRVAARARVGEFLPQVILIDREWFLENADNLLGSGMQDSLGNPTWGAYLTLAHVYRDAFNTLRPWFGRHAAGLPDLVVYENSIEKVDREWCVSRHYLEHAGKTYLYGCLARGESDNALERVFDGTRAEDRAHLYWQIFRGWSDAEKAPPEDYVERLLALWHWRLDTLEAAPNGEELAEEADGLGWLVITPHLPDARVLPLAMRTMRLAPRRRRTRRMAWPRLAQLGGLDPAAAMQMAELLIAAELADEWPHFDFDQVAPVLRIGLAAPDKTVRERAEWLVHRLGDRGWTEFGTLLSPAE